MVIVSALIGSLIALNSFAYAAPSSSGQTFCDSNCSSNSSNNSSLRLDQQIDISHAPSAIPVGSGYYSAHPIIYSSRAGSETWIKDMDTRSAVSMNHDINYAQAIDGNIELEARESHYNFGDYYSEDKSSVRMNINEDVTEGRVHIGALQGSDAASTAGDGLDSLMSAWKDPSMEMDEDYVGTYHIVKNMTVTTGQDSVSKSYNWLDCCDWRFLDTGRYPLRPITADDIFSCYSAR
jgi:hypothetical protein